MNKVILMGRLTRDPEVRRNPSNPNSTVARFSIAVDRRFKREGQPDADFFNCTSFGRQADFIENYLHKGTKIVLTGSVQNDNYTDKDGNQRYSVQIIVDEIEFAESKNASSGDGSNYGGPNAGGVPGRTVENNGFSHIPDSIQEDLPFT